MRSHVPPRVEQPMRLWLRATLERAARFARSHARRGVQQQRCYTRTRVLVLQQQRAVCLLLACIAYLDRGVIKILVW